MNTEKKIRVKNSAFIKVEKEKWEKINFEKITFVNSKGNNSIIYFENQLPITCYSPLYKFEKLLPYGFERIHRQYIVNMKLVKSVDIVERALSLHNGVNLNYSFSYKSNIQKYFVNPNKVIE